VNEIPLFPLGSVLFPGGLLELKVFEARYLDLVSRCLREGSAFGVVALKSGSEAGRSAEAVSFFDIGTFAEIIDVDSAQAGILHVRCRGGSRFTLTSSRQAADGLWLGETADVADDPHLVPGTRHAGLVESLSQAISTLAEKGAQPFLEPHRLDDAGWIANRWCEILPLPVEAKQQLLMLAEPLARLDVIDSLLRVRTAPD
jgi:Lon protease-like protein